MAKKEPRISINKLESVMDKQVYTAPLPGAENVEVRIKYNLSLSEMLQFVKDVVSSCVNMDDGTYIPEIMWFSIYTSVLTRYANFTLPSNVEKQYDLVYNTNAVAFVMQYINDSQYGEIVEAIKARIVHYRAIMENSALAEISKLANRMNAYVEQSEELFGNVSSEDMSSLVHNLANIENVDEEKLVKAVINAKDDMHIEAASPSSLSETTGNVIEIQKKD